MSIKSMFSELAEMMRLVEEMPAHLDDEANYGHLVNNIARHSNLHPEYIKHRLTTMIAMNMFSEQDMACTRNLALAYLEKENISTRFFMQRFTVYDTMERAFEDLGLRYNDDAPAHTIKKAGSKQTHPLPDLTNKTPTQT